MSVASWMLFALSTSQTITSSTAKIEFHANLQADARFYVDDDQHRFVDTFLLRRVRPWVDGKFFKFISVKAMADFGNGKVEIVDAFVEVEAHTALRIRAGKAKASVGLERLQSQTDL